MLKRRTRCLLHASLLLLLGGLMGVIQMPAIARSDSIPRLVGLPRVSPPGRSVQATSEPAEAVTVDLSLIDPRQSMPPRLEAWLGDSIVTL